MPTMNYLHECDTPMRSASRVKPRPGRYHIVASFPARHLHEHTDAAGCCPPGKEIPLEVVHARTSERVAQLDFVGPAGKVRKAYHMEIADFVDMNKECAEELRLAEVQFSIDCRLPYENLISKIHEALAPALAQDLVDDFDPSPIAGVKKEEAVNAIRSGRISKDRPYKPEGPAAPEGANPASPGQDSPGAEG